MGVSNEELLKYAALHGMIDIELMQKHIEMQKRKELLLNHPYEIYQGGDGKWYTYLPCEEGGRKKVKRNTREDVEDKVIEFWREKEENPTVESIFCDWVEDKLRYGEIEKSTYDRYLCYFNKYFQPLANEHIKSIDEDDIEEFVRNAICEFDMTAKCFSNFRTLIYGIFKRAKKRKFVSFGITELMNDMEISKRSFKKVVHKAEDQVFLPEEKRRMEFYLETHITILNLGLLLMFKTGMRVGELAALKRTDVKNYTIFINRTETRYSDGNGKVIYDVRNFPKTEAGVRFAVIPEKYTWIIDKIFELNPNGIYLFENSAGRRIRTYEFSRQLTRCEKQLCMDLKSPHKIRKTYGTILIDSNVKESTILDVMGHTEISMTKGHYYFDRSSIEDKRRELGNVADL